MDVIEFQQWASSAGMTASANSLAKAVVEFFSPIAPVIWIGVLVWKLLKDSLEEKEVKVDLKFIIRTTACLLLFYFFTNVAAPASQMLDYGIAGAMESIQEHSEADFQKKYFMGLVKSRQESLGITDADVKTLEDNFNYTDMEANFDLLEELQEERQGWFLTAWDNTTSFFTNLFNFQAMFADIGMAVTYVIVAALRLMMIGLLGAFDKILYAIGALSFLASMFPIWKNKMFEWLNTWLVVKFSLLTMGVVEIIRENMILGRDIDDSVLAGDTDFYAEISMQFASIIAMIATPWLTSKYIGSQDIGKALSIGTGLMYNSAKGLVGKLKGGGSKGGGGKGGGKGGGVLGAVGNMAKKGLKDNNPSGKA